MFDKVIKIAFYFLFFLTPLVWTKFNYELFEFNKMLFVYFLTTIIACFWIAKMIVEKKVILKSTPLDLPIILFLVANILSTIFSIDPHTSAWGYYSRANGGLLSIISYTILFYALVSNFNQKDVTNFLKGAIVGAVLVSLWAIPEHFGISLSCVLLLGEFTTACWVQDVQARVFATLGQPNWLGAYLSMLIFPALYFFLNSAKKIAALFYYLFIVIFYLAFTFTYSRGATLGLVVGVLVFVTFSFTNQLSIFKTAKGSLFSKILRIVADKGFNIKGLFIVIITFFIINLVFGSAFGRFQLISIPQHGAQTTNNNTSTNVVTRPVGTQLESGGTESGTIRLIVWRGALEIFKHYPIFGSGVETFAYSYYQYRPKEHNLVSEWDFLYNKAHNEYLNYLANTGIVGFVCYMFMIIAFILWSIKKIIHFSLPANIFLALLASYLSYLIQNIFGFSVVVIALLFYIFPAVSIISSSSVKDFKFPKKLGVFFSSLVSQTIYRRNLFKKLAILAVFIVSLSILFTLIKYWLADTYFAKGSSYIDSGESEGYQLLDIATYLNPGEPLYKSELGYAAAAVAAAVSEKNATYSAQIKSQAINETEKALKISPYNVSYWRTAIRTYFTIASIDSTYSDVTLKTIDATIKLAPTDAKLYYNKGIILAQTGKTREAISTLKQAIELKPNYREAYFTLGVFYKEVGETEAALDAMNTVLKLVPNDPDALEKINQWKEKPGE